MSALAVRILRPGDEAALEAYLLPRVESSMFLIGNMRASGLADEGQAYQGTYAAACEGGAIVAAVAHYWNRVLVLQAAAHLGALCRAAVAASGRPVGGLIGPADQVAAAGRVLGVDEANVRFDETEGLYRLPLAELVVPAALRTGAVRGRRARPGDLDLLAEWRAAYSVEALHEEEGPQLREGSRASTARLIEEGHLWLVEEGSRPVACSAFNTAIAEAVQVGGVWTPPALRRRGYARCAVASSLLDARAEGVGTAILFTGEGNVAAQRAYRALGFRQIGDYRLLFLRSPVEQ